MLRNLKKAAIFGVDARIAIIVFGILGAVGAYYSVDVISKAQNDSFLKQVQTLRQAAKQNVADNDYNYAIDVTNLNSNLFGVYTNSANLSRGRNNNSYINQTNPSATVGKTLINTPNRVIEVTNNNMYSSDLATGASFKTTDCATATCYYWFKMDNVPEMLFNILDEYYDATTGGFADAASIESGIVVAPVIDVANDSATVLVKIGEKE